MSFIWYDDIADDRHVLHIGIARIFGFARRDVAELALVPEIGFGIDARVEHMPMGISVRAGVCANGYRCLKLLQILAQKQPVQWGAAFRVCVAIAFLIFGPFAIFDVKNIID